MDQESGRSLHDEGWLQGSIFQADLTTTVCVLRDGLPLAETRSFSTWVVASQDCDLASAAAIESHPTVELRPVHRDNVQPHEWGIRSRKFRLDARSHVDAVDPHLHISPLALNSYRAAREQPLEAGRATAFKTWLGRRYDRPAVPTEYVGLARSIATEVRGTRAADLADECQDVLMQFAEGEPPQFVLWAVVADDSDPAPFETWLSEAALGVPPELGVMAELPQVVSKNRLSLEVLENSYAADLSNITWGAVPDQSRTSSRVPPPGSPTRLR